MKDKNTCKSNDYTSPSCDLCLKMAIAGRSDFHKSMLTLVKKVPLKLTESTQLTLEMEGKNQLI